MPKGARGRGRGRGGRGKGPAKAKGPAKVKDSGNGKEKDGGGRGGKTDAGGRGKKIVYPSPKIQNRWKHVSAAAKAPKVPVPKDDGSTSESEDSDELDIDVICQKILAAPSDIESMDEGANASESEKEEVHRMPVPPRKSRIKRRVIESASEDEPPSAVPGPAKRVTAIPEPAVPGCSKEPDPPMLARVSSPSDAGDMDDVPRPDPHGAEAQMSEDEEGTDDVPEYDIFRSDADEIGNTDDEAEDLDWMPSESESDGAYSDTEESTESEEEADPDASSSDFMGFSPTHQQTALPRYGTRPNVETKFVQGPPREKPTKFLFNVGNTRRVGVIPRMGPNPKPLDYFSLFFKEEDFVEIAHQTNLYADQQLREMPLPAHSRFKKWKQTNVMELKNFFALQIAMGLTKQTDLKSYWSTSPVTQTPFYPSTMSRDRFANILSMFHLADNNRIPHRDAPNYTPLKKLGPIFNDILDRFNNVYNPNREISIDEGMVPWRGRLRFKVYNKNKPKKYGMKAYMLCDAHNGYVMKFHLYYPNKDKDDVGVHGKLHDIVMNLLKGRLHVGHHVFMDNFYTSPTLFTELLNRGTDCTGTLRPNRQGTPRSIQDVRVGKGNTHIMHAKVNAKTLQLVKYHDRSIVYLLSSLGTDEKVAVQNRRRRDQETEKPQIVDMYNKFMGGVDLADQMVSYRNVSTKTLKWWKKLFFHVINFAIMNAYILYKMRYNQKRVTQCNFREEIVYALVAQVDYSQLPVPVPSLHRQTANQNPPFRLAAGNHFPAKYVSPRGSTRKTHGRRCAVCSPAEKKFHQDNPDEMRKGRKRFGSESVYYCSLCNTALCVTPCFRIYHTAKDYVQFYIDDVYRPKHHDYVQRHPDGPSPPRPKKGGRNRKSTTTNTTTTTDEDGHQRREDAAAAGAADPDN